MVAFKGADDLVGGEVLLEDGAWGEEEAGHEFGLVGGLRAVDEVDEFAGEGVVGGAQVREGDVGV